MVENSLSDNVVVATRRIRRRPVGRPTVETAQQLESALLQVAAELFQEKGFSRTTMREISQRAAASRQSLYARFPNKTALFEALMRQRSSALLADVTEILAGDGDVRKTLQAFGVQLLGTYLNSDLQRLHQVVIAEAANCPKVAQTFYDLGPGRGRAALAAFLERQTENGKLDVRNPDWVAGQFLGSLVGSVVLRSTLSISVEMADERTAAEWVKLAVDTLLAAHKKK